VTDISANVAASHPEFVSVAVAGSLFALDIMAVREIRGWSASTPLPQAPAHVLGMINLRGSILPVVDLGALLGLAPCNATPSSVVVVVQVGERQIGVVVDSVQDILAASEGALTPTPDVGGRSAEVVAGVMTTGEGIVSVLALDRLLEGPELIAA
jgi:purine-binding chemotaxis protein CheW